MPGEFEPQEEEQSHAQAMDHSFSRDDSPSHLSSFLPGLRDPSSLLDETAASGVELPNNTTIQERELNRKLAEVESSFLPEVSEIAVNNGQNTGADDTFMFGLPNRNVAMRKRPQPIDVSSAFRDVGDRVDNEDMRAASPHTPDETYKTPHLAQDGFPGSEHSEHHDSGVPNTSALERMSSSPATVARTVSRVQSLATIGGYETAAEESELPDSPSKKPASRADDDDEATPRKSAAGLLTVPDTGGTHNSSDLQGSKKGRRPKYLNSRSSSARLSYDSMASSTTDASDATLGADYSLQSGGAVSDRGRRRRGEQLTISRQASLGSMASGIALSDDEGRPPTAFNTGLSTLQEESLRSNNDQRRTPTGPETPRQPAIVMPTDTVIAENVRGIEVPGTFARQYRQERDMSPSKTLSMAVMTPAPKKGLTLKEHRSTVEKYSKENFDLKMKVHFLNEALLKRSDDGVKELITENVQLKSDRMRLEKENHSLRKRNRELQKKLDESNAQNSPRSDQGYGTDDERSPTQEEEVLYLRERVETTEVEIEKLRAENIAKESEKRRLAEMIRSMGESTRGTSDVGSREERDMWKDMLEAESIAREQADETNKKLRDEVAKLKQDALGGQNKPRRGYGASSIVSRASSGDTLQAQSAELERLRHEVSELQKTISAQASALTSRNKEKERLYQEIEDLKIRMGGARSVAGDSILERSASRARSHSRASTGTKYLNEQDRENLELYINDLRDENNQLKLDKQQLSAEVEEALQELEAIDLQAEADAKTFNQELEELAKERDVALQAAEEHEQAFLALREEAQAELDAFGDDLDAKNKEVEELQQRLQASEDDLSALRSELHSASEGLVRLEDDAQQNLARYHSVKGELDDANREIESMEKSLAEQDSKIQRLTVQQESSRNEIAFLREEQDGDKIKIGDLESLLKKVHLNLDSEREKSRDLENRIKEERQQRDMLASKKDKDVQKMITGLNQELGQATEHLRQTRKELSSREIELTLWKDRTEEIEESLRNIVHDPSASRASLMTSIEKMARDLEINTMDLESTRRHLDELQTILSNRDQLVENGGLELKKLQDALERERQGRRQDKHSFDQTLKSQQQATRAMTANSSRINELEQARVSDRRRLTQVENQLKEQLADRNKLLLELWKKISSLCGPDWAHNNSLINGNLPSQEVIGNMLFWPGFSRNILLAAKQVEGVFVSFKDKIKRVERDLYKDYRGLEHTMELRTKRLERMEESWEKTKAKFNDDGPSRSGSARSGISNEVSKLKGENRLLKAELALYQQQHHRHNSRQHRPESRTSLRSGGALSNDGLPTIDGAVGLPPRTSSVRRIGQAPALERHHTTNIVEHLASVNDAPELRSIRSNSISSRTSGYVITSERTQDDRRGLMVPAGPFNAPANGNFSLPPREPAPMPPTAMSNASGSENGNLHNVAGGPGQERWIHRLRELERRLKAEREARLLDRSGMRKRLEERDEVNDALRMELERERSRNSADYQRPHQLEGAANGHQNGSRQLSIGGIDERYDSDLLEATEVGQDLTPLPVPRRE